MTPDWPVGVCGFGRCGSTMTMEMLTAGGLPTVDGCSALSHELYDLRQLSRRQPPGRAIKLLDHPGKYGVPPANAWRFVWLDRDPREQARSMLKMLGDQAGRLTVSRLVRAADRDRPGFLSLLRQYGPVTILSFEEVLADPFLAAARLTDVWPGLDITAAAEAVHARGPKCLSDLAFELSTPDGAP